MSSELLVTSAARAVSQDSAVISVHASISQVQITVRGHVAFTSVIASAIMVRSISEAIRSIM